MDDRKYVKYQQEHNLRQFRLRIIQTVFYCQLHTSVFVFRVTVQTHQTNNNLVALQSPFSANHIAVKETERRQNFPPRAYGPDGHHDVYLLVTRRLQLNIIHPLKLLAFLTA